jgi:hypothetical protein
VWNKLVRCPAWWQFRVFAWIGLLLVWLPSGAVAFLDTYLHQHELHNPVAISLIAVELALICYGAYWFGRGVERGA